MLKLSINNADLKEHGTASQVYEVLKSEYLGLDDQYSGYILWSLSDGEKVITENMPCALFYAHCENVRSFVAWLSIVHRFKI